MKDYKMTQKYKCNQDQISSGAGIGFLKLCWHQFILHR